MKHLILWTLALFFFLSTAALGEIYKWVDDRGVTHFTDDLRKIPDKYRGDAQDFEKTEHRGSVTFDPTLGKPAATATQEEPFYRKYLRQIEEEERVAKREQSSHDQVILYMTDW